ncbi:MAG: zinc-binding dehydrogenase [Promethearchaeota archaeon]
MKVLMKTAKGEGNVEFKDVEPPKINSDEMLVEIKAAGICGTDLHILHDKSYYIPPVTLGHEYSGIVIEIGDDVKDFEIGDKVTSPATINCGICHFCRIGATNRCIDQNKRILGVARANGAFASYMAVPAKIAHKLPKDIPFEEAALAEPAACAVHATEVVPVNMGDTVAILGPGPMGLLILQLAKLSGAAQTIVTGITADQDRMKIAKELGADLTINIDEENPVTTIKKLTDGLGADIVFDCSGAPPAQKQAFDIVRRRGNIVLVGLTGREINISLDKIVEGELEVKGSWGTLWTSWKLAIKLISLNKLQVRPLISATLPLEQWEKGFQLMESKEAIKVLLMP